MSYINTYFLCVKDVITSLIRLWQRLAVYKTVTVLFCFLPRTSQRTVKDIRNSEHTLANVYGIRDCKSEEFLHEIQILVHNLSLREYIFLISNVSPCLKLQLMFIVILTKKATIPRLKTKISASC
jgi:hypothetical protein